MFNAEEGHPFETWHFRVQLAEVDETGSSITDGLREYEGLNGV